MAQGAHKFVSKLSTPARFATSSISIGITSLDHELLDATMKDEAVEVTLFGKSAKVLDRFRAFGSVEFDRDVSKIGLHDSRDRAIEVEFL